MRSFSRKRPLLAVSGRSFETSMAQYLNELQNVSKNQRTPSSTFSAAVCDQRVARIRRVDDFGGCDSLLSELCFLLCTNFFRSGHGRVDTPKIAGDLVPRERLLLAVSSPPRGQSSDDRYTLTSCL